MTKRSLSAASVCDVILFLYDGREGLSLEDRRVAKNIRKLDVPVRAVVTKCERQQYIECAHSESPTLGFGDSAAGGSILECFWSV